MTEISRPLRLAEAVGALSLATDLAMGQPLEHGLRTAVLAVRMAQAMGLPERARLARAAAMARSAFGGITEFRKWAASHCDVARVLGARMGFSKQVARRLGISPKTCDHHIQRLYGKAGVSTRAGATLFALEHGLVRLD